MAVHEPYQKQLLHHIPAKCMGYVQIISSRLYVRLKGTCSLAGRALSNTGEKTK